MLLVTWTVLPIWKEWGKPFNKIYFNQDKRGYNFFGSIRVQKNAGWKLML